MKSIIEDFDKFSWTRTWVCITLIIGLLLLIKD